MRFTLQSLCAISRFVLCVLVLVIIMCLGVWEGFLWPSFIFPPLLRFFLGLRCEEFKWALSEGQKVLQQGHNGQLSAPQGVSPPLLPSTPPPPPGPLLG